MERKGGFKHTSSKGENLDVTEHRWRALQECDTSYILSCVDLVGIFCLWNPRNLRMWVNKYLQDIFLEDNIYNCLVIFMAVSSPTAPRITSNCGSAHELESPEVQNWVTMLTLLWLTLIYLVQWTCYWITRSCRPKIDQMLEEWEIIVFKVRFCLLVVKINI